jgi:hypothetical protein
MFVVPKLQDLFLEPAQLSPESSEAHPCNLGHLFVTWIGDDIEQLLDPLAANRSGDPELGKMSPDHIDHCGLLADEQMARAMERQTALLLGRLGLDEPHVRPGNGLADRLRVRGIILLPFNVWLHVGRRHQPHGVSERLELTRPMVRLGTGFDADQGRWQLLKNRQDVAALQLTSDNYIALRINAVDLEHRLGDVVQRRECRDVPRTGKTRCQGMQLAEYAEAPERNN